MCQCPVSGWNHFYEVDCKLHQLRQHCVNALNRAGIISTSNLQKIIEIHDMCQCPESGWNHFYIMIDCTPTHLAALCQCPESGWNHFYQSMIDFVLWIQVGVNALNRAGIISTLYQQERREGLLRCQCPESGWNHFYGTDIYLAKRVTKKCQCPESGWNHFYGTLWEALQIKGSRGCFCTQLSDNLKDL